LKNNIYRENKVIILKAFGNVTVVKIGNVTAVKIGNFTAGKIKGDNQKP